MNAHVHVALLVCGKLAGPALDVLGDYNDVYFKFLHDTKPDTVLFTMDAFDVVHRMEYPDETKYDAIVLTGSAASAYEDVEWVNKLVAYIARVADIKPTVKLIGICFGHQIIARALGGSCVPNSEWELGPTPLTLTDLGKRLFDGADGLTLEQMHRDHVPTVPPNFHLLASTPVSPNQGMVRFYTSVEPDAPLPLIQIFTVQGHPEFVEPIVTALIETRSASGVIPRAAAEESERRRFWRNDGAPVGKVVWEVILGTK